MSSFGDRLRSRRLLAQLRQTDFFQHGITQSQLSMMESGSIEPSADKIERLAGALKLAPLDLVAGTNLEASYLELRFTAEEKSVIEHVARFTRSERIVTVQESYNRIGDFLTILSSGQTANHVTLEDETYYQNAVRILQRSIDGAREHADVLAERIFVPVSLIGESETRFAGWRVSLQRSLALIASLILEYPEANESAARREIVLKIGLDRIDRYLERFARAFQRSSVLQ